MQQTLHRKDLDELKSLINSDSHNAYNMALVLSQRATDIEDNVLKGDIFHATGLACHEVGKLDLALKWYHDALIIRQSINDKRGEAITLNNIGLVYHDLGKFSGAVPYYEKAIALKKEIKDLKSLTASYENLGVAYWKLADYTKAMDVYFKGLKIAEELKDSLRMASALQNIGVIYLFQGNERYALDKFKEAVELRKNSEDKIPIVQLDNNIGIILKKLGQLNESLNYFKQCLQLSIDIKYRTGVMAAYNNMGEIFVVQGKYEEAKEAFTKCLALASENSEHMEHCISANNLGELHIILKRYDEALEYLNTSLDLSLRMEDKAKEQDAYMNLTRLYEEKGDMKEALRYYKLYDGLKSSILSTKSSDEINELKIRYEVEKKEKEVQHAKLLQIESELKALRAQMDPHFIFNALGSMRKELLEGNNEKADEYMVRFSRLLRMILDTSRTPIVRLSDNIELLHLYIQIEQARQANRFEYTIQLEKGLRAEDVHVPGLILQPLVENAIVHGLFHKTDGQGKLAIKFKRMKDVLEVTITDNGVGRQNSAGKKAPSHKSHATSIIRETLDLIWAGKEVSNYFTVNDKVNEKGEPAGTEVIVLLPLNEGK